jgi:hypothetical protein
MVNYKRDVAFKNILQHTYKFLIRDLGKYLFPMAQQFLAARA